MFEVRDVSSEEDKLTRLLRGCSQRNVLIAIEAGVSLDIIMDCLIQYDDNEFSKAIKRVLERRLEGIYPD